MRTSCIVIIALLGWSALAFGDAAKPYTGSRECRECHTHFYKLWSTSFHGLAMQPFTAELAQTKLTPQTNDVVIGQYKYRAAIHNGVGTIVEHGPRGEQTYPIEHVMGGKNVFYFLTPRDKGRLQVLPISYDVQRHEWYDTTKSAMRHFTDNPDEALHWTERPLTFNTSCFNCHVSQLAKNYDLASDTYHTTWVEPGINCETCHGPGGDHIRVCRAAQTNEPPADLKLFVVRTATQDQKNSLCAPCHAKMHPVTPEFPPGARYFDNYGLVALEDRDFYPDGRDLGENYTYTGWLMNPCAQTGQLDCTHCHTSSGRNRFKDALANNACLPCHEDKTKNLAVHTHHKLDGEGSKCVACHMPMTEFGRMRRSDHSFRPPMPAATLAFKSPNACNICHTDKDAAWSDKFVRQWHTNDYQAATLQWAGLIDAARKREWTKLPAMLDYLAGTNRNQIVTTGLVRLLRGCDNDQKWAAFAQLLADKSPLVRASAVEALGDDLRAAHIAPLLAATRDDFRLVRIQAATVLARLPREGLADADRQSLDRATAEYETSLKSRPDDGTAHYNLGNFYMDQRNPEQAIASYQTAIKLQPENLAPFVNSALAYNVLGQNDKAEASLRHALTMEPTNSAVNLNLALLLGEQGKLPEAEQAFRATLQSDPRNAVAAYNLAVLVAPTNPAETITLCRRAAELRPQEPKYAYTLAFYQRQQNQTQAAIQTLEQLLRQKPATLDPYLLLGQIYEDLGRVKDALTIYRQAVANDLLPATARSAATARIDTLTTE